mmetsp:Transcript_42063/g.82623  ORF Transcript_42063/g.82623 Transcript_42063/m.82623 type:complete len:270 (+) Transcript_42063:736-1545(+)
MRRFLSARASLAYFLASALGSSTSGSKESVSIISISEVKSFRILWRKESSFPIRRCSSVCAWTSIALDIRIARGSSSFDVSDGLTLFAAEAACFETTMNMKATTRNSDHLQARTTPHRIPERINPTCSKANTNPIPKSLSPALLTTACLAASAALMDLVLPPELKANTGSSSFPSSRACTRLFSRRKAYSSVARLLFFLPDDDIASATLENLSWFCLSISASSSSLISCVTCVRRSFAEYWRVAQMKDTISNSTSTVYTIIPAKSMSSR